MKKCKTKGCDEKQYAAKLCKKCYKEAFDNNLPSVLKRYPVK